MVNDILNNSINNFSGIKDKIVFPKFVPKNTAMIRGIRILYSEI